MARPRQYRDPDVLTRAMLAFWRHGYAGCAVPELEAATGLRASSLYHRFGSKEGLFEAVLAHYLEKVVDWRIQRYLQDPDPVAGLRRFLDTTHDYIDLAAGRLPMACLLLNTAIEHAPAEDRVMATVAAGMARVEAAFATTLARAQATGQLDAGADVARLARQLLLGLQGLLVLSRVRPDPAYLQEACAALMAGLPLKPESRPRQGATDERPAHA